MKKIISIIALASLVLSTSAFAAQDNRDVNLQCTESPKMICTIVCTSSSPGCYLLLIYTNKKGKPAHLELAHGANEGEMEKRAREYAKEGLCIYKKATN